MISSAEFAFADERDSIAAFAFADEPYSTAAFAFATRVIRPRQNKLMADGFGDDGVVFRRVHGC